jgi:hypothetical protein
MRGVKMRRDYAKLKRVILEFDNGHDTVLYSEDYRFKLKKMKLKIKRRS